MNLRQIVALVIWWCEGTKPRKDKRWKNSYSYSVEVINSNPRIIRIFLDFLRQDLKVQNSRIKGQIQIHEGDNQAEIERYWARITGLSTNQFDKTIIRKRGNKPGKNKGTFKVRLYNKEVYKKLSFLLEDALQKLTESGAVG